MSESTTNPTGATKTNGHSRKGSRPKVGPNETARLLEEAETLKTALRTATAAANELTQGLRRQRKQSQLVQTTLASLRQLQDAN